MEKARRPQPMGRLSLVVVAAGLMLSPASVPAAATASTSAVPRPAVASPLARQAPGHQELASCVNDHEVYDWAAIGEPVPPQVPFDPASRVGAYSWGLDLTTYSPSDGNVLDWGARHVTATGTHTISVFLGFRDDYDLGLGSSPSLLSVAENPAYTDLFNNPRLSTYILTTYSPTDQASAWVGGYSCAAAANETDQMRDLGVYLLTRYPTKRFIIQNWEGDNAMAGTNGSDTAWMGYRAWIDARTAGIWEARDLVPHSGSRLLSALQFNRIEGCNTTTAKCVITDVAPFVHADMYSYSSYESINPGPTSSIEPLLSTNLTTALQDVRQAYPATQPSQFDIGEFGFPRNAPGWGECNVADREAAVIQTIESWGASYGIVWEIIDNSAASGLFADDLGLYKYDGTASLSLQTLQQFYRTGVPALPSNVSCPMLTSATGPGGSSTGVPPGSTISIQGTGFTGAGDVVHFYDSPETQRFTAGVGSPGWSDSKSEITVQTPAAARGLLLVYVRNAHRVDSDGQFITLSGPAINAGGVANDGNSVISIYGSGFSGSADTVRLRANGRSYTVGAGSPNFYDSTGQINAELPGALDGFNGPIAVAVVDASGVESNVETLAPPGPTINSVQNQIGSSAPITPGSEVVIQGSGFSGHGDIVHLDSGNVNDTIRAGASGWSDSPTQIEFRVPEQLGQQAVVYVTNECPGANCAQSNLSNVLSITLSEP